MKTNEAALESNSEPIPISENSGYLTRLGSRVLSITGIVLGSTVLGWTALEVVGSWNSKTTARMCLPLAIGIALIAVGTFAGTAWRQVVWWGGLALVGQAASLQMIDAGRLIHFQHYRPIYELFSQNSFALFLVVLQTVCVVFGLWPRFSAIREWLRRFPLWRLSLIVLVLSLSTSAVTPNAATYITGLGIGTFIQFVSIANIVLLAWSVPPSVLDRVRETIDGFLGGDNPRSDKPRLDRFAVIAASAMVLLTASLSFFVYEAHPHVPDESQYLFQAKYMAAGQLSVKAPAVPEAFSMYMVPFQESRWYGIFPPAWPAFLALGTLIGASWLVNPVLSGLCILLSYLFFQEFYSRPFARMAILLLCCSPWFIFMGMSYMSHVATLLFSLGAALLTMRGCRNKSKAVIFIAGLSVGVLGLIRPLDAAIVGLLLVFWAMFNETTWKSRISTCGVLTLGAAVMSSLALPYNSLVTGSAALSPSDAYYNKYFWPNVMAIGFGPERGMHWGLDAFPGHSPLEAVVNAALNIFQLNTELFGWGAGSLLLLVLFAFSRSLSKKDLWAIVVTVCVIAAYSLFWYHGGPDFGARYWFLIIIPLIALTIRGCEWMSGTVAPNGGGHKRERVHLAAAVMCVVSLLTYLPWRAADKYYGYLGMQPGIKQLAKEKNFGRSLVIVRGEEHPDYQSAWIYNPVDFEGDDPIYALERDPQMYDDLMRSYPDRPVYIVNGPTLSDGQYSVVKGPLAARELLGN